MNFDKIPPVEFSKSMLDQAFKKARVKGMQKNLKGNWLQIIRKKEGLKLDIIKDTIVPKLDRIIKSFPSFDHLPQFYHKLMKLTLDYKQLKRSLGAVDWAIRRIRFFHRSYVSKITRTVDRQIIKNHSKEFYGRISSILKQIEKDLRYLENARQVMKTYPDIKDFYTVAIYGFPNIGKTTLLNKLTGSTAKTASYSFTTKSINCSYFTKEKQKIQVLDVPGTLARKDKMNLIELQAELVLTDLAQDVIYIFDLTESYPLKDQIKLYEKVKRVKPVVCYLSKTDVLPADVVKKFSEHKIKTTSLEDIKQLLAKKASVWEKER